MTETNSALARKVKSIQLMAYRKLTDVPSRLTDGKKWNESLSKLPIHHFIKKKAEANVSAFLIPIVILINRRVKEKS